MNKQEAIDKINNMATLKIRDTTVHQQFETVDKNKVLNIISQINEHKKPVVPQFVADFYESIKDSFEWSLYNLYIDFHKRELQEDLHEWFRCDMNKPIETIVKMKLYGYEVEKEKLYTVEIPNQNGFVSLVLCKGCDGKLFVATFSGGVFWQKFEKCKLTESEIKEDFEWAFQFAEEVEE